MAGIDSEELRNFVRSTIDSVEQGLKDSGYTVMGNIEFELAVVNLKKGGGGIKLFVVDASAKYGKENVSKIKFKVRKKGAGHFG